MKKKWLDAYMDVAERFAQLSTAKKLKVGSVVVKDHRIVSIGYNGTPAGWDNNCETVIDTGELPPMLITNSDVIHAEANAITKLARDGESGKGATLFCTHAPCVDCAKLIYGAGISKVYYRDAYRNTVGLAFLIKSGIDVEQLRL